VSFLSLSFRARVFPSNRSLRRLPSLCFLARSDIAIATAQTPKPIINVAAEIGLQPDEVESYGRYKAKIELSVLDRFVSSFVSRVDLLSLADLLLILFSQALSPKGRKVHRRCWVSSLSLLPRFGAGRNIAEPLPSGPSRLQYHPHPPRRGKVHHHHRSRSSCEFLIFYSFPQLAVMLTFRRVLFFDFFLSSELTSTRPPSPVFDSLLRDLPSVSREEPLEEDTRRSSP